MSITAVRSTTEIGDRQIVFDIMSESTATGGHDFEVIMKIGDASQASGVSQRMIRHYEKIGLMPPAARRSSGYRDYDDVDVYRLRFIANARDLGFPIDEIRALLALWQDRSRASSEVKALAEARATALGRKAALLEQMRSVLLDLARRCHGDDRPECPIIDRLAS